MVRRAPGVTSVAVLSLSLGIGAAAAVFNLADAVLFRPLSVEDPASLRHFRATLGFGIGAKKDVYGASPDEVEAMRRAADFADLIAFRTADEIAWTMPGAIPAWCVRNWSRRSTSGTGVPAQAGRLLEAGDRGPSPVPVVVSEALWRAAMAADPAAVGRSALLNGAPATIVGIAGSFGD